MKRILVLLVFAGLSGESAAMPPIESAMAFLGKLFKGGAVVKEAAVAGRATEGAAAKGLERVPAGESVLHSSALPLAAIEPRPNLALDPIAKNHRDADAYKALRAAAANGDASAMVKMWNLTVSGKVSDPGEPYHAYWLFQAVRAGSQQATQKLRNECAQSAEKRKADQWFDSGCRSVDGKTFYVGAWRPAGDPTYREVQRILQQ